MNKINCLSPPPHDVGQLMADTKVVQKSAYNWKIMLLAIRLAGWLAVSAGQIIHV